jgi:hypothetical protein
MQAFVVLTFTAGLVMQFLMARHAWQAVRGEVNDSA